MKITFSIDEEKKLDSAYYLDAMCQPRFHKMVDATFSESYGSRSSHSKFSVEGAAVRRVVKSEGILGTKENICKFVKDVFLPQGYPDSVSRDYLEYQTWDTVQAFCSYITGTLATQAVLKGVGVGDSTASPVAATITWLLKDGLGMVGRIVFAWLKGTDLDSNAKRWRLVADILNDVAMCLDLLAPIFPSFFMAIVCLSSVTRSLVGVAGGATRAAVVQHQARRDNMADVSAKDGSQETVVNLAGLIIGLVLTPILAGRTVLIWLMFFCFTALHLYANYRAVSVISMETFNRARLYLFMKQFLSSGGENIPTPKIINSQEPVIRGGLRSLHIHLGSSLVNVLLSSQDFENALNQQDNNYIIKLSSNNTVYISFGSASNNSDHLKAAVTAEILEYIIANEQCIPSTNGIFSKYLFRINNQQSPSGLVALANEIAQDVFTDGLLSKMEDSGWVTSHHLLGIQEWRYFEK